MAQVPLSGALEAAAAIRDGRYSSEEIVGACLKRIEEFEPGIGAWAHLDAERALEQARQADHERRRGRPVGPLHGVPVGIKDVLDTGDFPTECGTALLAGRTPSKDAAVVSRLRAAGAVILGKTVTSELAVYTPGKTRNPHDTGRTPGGSSSGSAAAVAAFMTPLALGTQTNGSVIRPAAFCGVYGYKPTFGLVSRHGALRQSPPLDTIGAFARDLADLALIGDAMIGYDPRDEYMRPRARPRLGEVLAEQPPAEPRLAFVRSAAWDKAEESTKDAFRELVEHVEGRIDVLDLPPSFDDAWNHLNHLMLPDLARHYDRLYRRGADGLSERLLQMLEQGRSVSAIDYNTALSAIEDYNAVLDEIFQDYDAILTPATAGEAPPAETTGDPAFCTTWTLCGTPALSLPLLQGPNGLPLGAQLVGSRHDDARLFRTARWLVGRVADA